MAALMSMLVAAITRTSTLTLQQFGLQYGRHFADFIEEDGAVVTDFKLAGLGLDRTGKGAGLIAEEFTLQQIGGHGRAIDLHEGAVAAGRHLVDEQGGDFLASAALSQDEDGDVSARHQPALGFDLPHPRAGSDKGGVFIQGNFLALIVIAGRLIASLLEALLHGQINVGLSEGLEDHVSGAHARGRDDFFQLGGTGKHDDRKRWPGGMQPGQQFEGIFPGAVFVQLPIHQEQVRRGRVFQAQDQIRGLGVQVHGEAVLENSVKVIQDCGIRVKRHDVRFALALRLQIRP